MHGTVSGLSDHPPHLQQQVKAGQCGHLWPRRVSRRVWEIEWGLVAAKDLDGDWLGPRQTRVSARSSPIEDSCPPMARDISGSALAEGSSNVMDAGRTFSQRFPASDVCRGELFRALPALVIHFTPRHGIWTTVNTGILKHVLWKTHQEKTLVILI